MHAIPLLFGLSFLLPLCLAITSTQFPLNFDYPLSNSPNGTQVWRHPTSENHYIQVRSCNLCPGGDLWSGYFHSVTEKISIFFIFARASQNPEYAPIALWGNGGPGTSALGAAFSKATGCFLKEDFLGIRLEYKPDSEPKPWNDKVNVIFIEQPLGTGFTRGHGKGEDDSRIGAEYIYEFLQVVLARHPHVPSVSLHSLSYGGHFVPEWASKIITENGKVKMGGSVNHVIPLKSVTMGNAWFGSDEQYLSRFDVLCEPLPFIPGSNALLRPEECRRVYSHRDTCAKLLKQCRNDPSGSCAPAHLWCLTAIGFNVNEMGRNALDISSFKTNIGWDTYPELTKYLNMRYVQLALGAIGPEDSTYEWIFDSTKVSVLHTLAGDHARRTDILLPTILDAGVDVLIYQGMLDIVCNFQGARKVIELQNLVEGEISQGLENWKHGSGRYICNSPKPKQASTGRFCYLEIDNVGHGVALEYDGWPGLFESWILEGSV